MFHGPIDSEQSTTPVSVGQNGGIQIKTIAQINWENAVRSEFDKMIEENVFDYYPYMQIPLGAVEKGNQGDIRPRLYDPATKRWMLVDTGAQVSVWPRQDYPEAEEDPTLMLVAVNKSKIPTHGTKQRQIKIGRKPITSNLYWQQ